MFGRLVSAFAAASFAGAYTQVQLGHERVNFPLGKLAVPISASNAADPNVHLHALPTNQFTSFGHPSFPAHTLRIKRTFDFCDPTVKAYSGYIDADYGAKHLFFYFFESRGDPDKDDVLMWINGGEGDPVCIGIAIDTSEGPGCSSSLGLFMELGPCSVLHPPSGNGTKWNPHSWNAKANLFFLDQPCVIPECN
jgi:carboxypeptidase C (cathepsin A)